MIAGDKAADEDAGTVEKAVKIRTIGSGISLPDSRIRLRAEGFW
jgi:hypothetical protein